MSLQKTANTLVTNLLNSVEFEYTEDEARNIVANAFDHSDWASLEAVFTETDPEEIQKAERFQEAAKRANFRENPVKLDKPFTLCVAAFACGDNVGYGPSWAKIEIDQDFLNNLHRTQKVCLENAWEVSCDYVVDEWEADDEYRIQEESLHIASQFFWYRGFPKHADYAVETVLFSIDSFCQMIEDRNAGNDFLAWAEDTLFLSNENVKDFAKSLLDSGDIDVSAIAVEAM